MILHFRKNTQNMTAAVAVTWWVNGWRWPEWSNQELILLGFLLLILASARSYNFEARTKGYFFWFLFLKSLVVQLCQQQCILPIRAAPVLQKVMGLRIESPVLSNDTPSTDLSYPLWQWWKKQLMISGRGFEMFRARWVHAYAWAPSWKTCPWLTRVPEKYHSKLAHLVLADTTHFCF